MELFPPMASLIRHLENKSMKGRRIGLCGTYSWAGAALKEMSAFVERSKGGWALVEPNISIKSGPGPHDLEICGELGRNMAKEIKRGDGN
jgi:flavorubredoxin